MTPYAKDLVRSPSYRLRQASRKLLVVEKLILRLPRRIFGNQTVVEFVQSTGSVIASALSLPLSVDMPFEPFCQAVGLPG